MTIDPTKTFFCPAPWDQMYHHLDNASPCHTNRNEFGLTPTEYLKSDFLKQLKKDFAEGKIPPSCSMCKEREDLGIKSTRLSIVKKRDSQGNFFYNKEDYTADKETVIRRLELRTSNLCNFKCRMCDASSSSQIARERADNPELSYFSGDPVNVTEESSLEELKNIALDGVEVLCLTGGEPMLIKQYYEFLDLLIEKKLTRKIMVELFTNCSVYNPLFIDRLKKFRKVRFVMSIDGVGKTAEYQRKGTDWNVVEQNIYKFVTMSDPFEIYFNTAISPYVLLDASSLASFLMKLQGINDKIRTKCYYTVKPDPLHLTNIDKETRKRIVEQIDIAADILTADNFAVLKKEFLDIKRNLLYTDPINPKLFIKYTDTLDRIRNEKFEDVFGYKLG